SKDPASGANPTLHLARSGRDRPDEPSRPHRVSNSHLTRLGKNLHQSSVDRKTRPLLETGIQRGSRPSRRSCLTLLMRGPSTKGDRGTAGSPSLRPRVTTESSRVAIRVAISQQNPGITAPPWISADPPMAEAVRS